MPEPTNPTPPQDLPRAAALTPAGTPIVIPGAVPTGAEPKHLTPETVQLLTAALNALPPGAGKKLLTQYWGYVLALLVPLILTTYQNVKEIWQGPATIAAIRQEYADDHKAVEALQKRLDETERKLDQILWILNKQGGASAPDKP